MARTTERILTVSLLLAASILQPARAQMPSGKHPDELQQRLLFEDFRILSDKAAGKGIMGARKWRIVFSDGFEMKVKWKRAPRSGDGWNNSPRREVAAFIVQRLFLDPKDYVVPPTAPRCVPLSVYRSIDGEARSNRPGAQCVYGVLSAWLEDVRPPRRRLDRRRFKEAGPYAYHLGNVNLLSYLINHQDSRKSNFLITTKGEPRTFLIDNGLAFSPVFRNVFVRHWNKIRVPALPRSSVERLRQVDWSQLQGLGCLVRMRLDGDDILRPVSLGAGDGVGDQAAGQGELRLGLTPSEIADIQSRLRRLLYRIDRGRIVVFGPPRNLGPGLAFAGVK